MATDPNLTPAARRRPRPNTGGGVRNISAALAGMNRAQPAAAAAPMNRMATAAPPPPRMAPLAGDGAGPGHLYSPEQPEARPAPGGDWAAAHALTHQGGPPVRQAGPDANTLSLLNQAAARLAASRQRG